MARAAWRDVSATRSASLLAAALVAVPVSVLTATDVLAGAAQVSGGEALARQLGQADARIVDLGARPIAQRPDGRGFRSDQPAGQPVGPTAGGARDVQAMLALLPRGATATSDATARVRVRLGAVTMPVTARELDYGAPATRGLIIQRAGRAPAGPGEVAISSALREQTNTSLGDTLALQDGGASLRVVGVVDDPNDLASVFALGQPGSLFSAGRAALAPVVRQSWLVRGIGDLRWPAVRRLNAQGLLVVSRAVLRDPPPTDQAPYCRDTPCDQAPTVADTGGLRLAGARLSFWLAAPGLLVLVGAGFGGALVACARRQRHGELWALADGVAAPAPAVTLVGAAAIGVAGCLIGAPLGLGLAAALRGALRPMLARELGPLDPHPAGVLVIAGFGVLAALAPAYRRWRDHRRPEPTGGPRRVPALRGAQVLREDGRHE